MSTKCHLIKNPNRNHELIARSLDPSIVPKETKLLYDEEINKIKPSPEDSDDDDMLELEMETSKTDGCAKEYLNDVVNLF